MSADIIQFIPRPDPNREERELKRLQEAARALYQAIFPDTAPAEYCAPDKDPA